MSELWLIYVLRLRKNKCLSWSTCSSSWVLPGSHEVICILTKSKPKKILFSVSRSSKQQIKHSQEHEKDLQNKSQPEYQTKRRTRTKLKDSQILKIQKTRKWCNAWYQVINFRKGSCYQGLQWTMCVLLWNFPPFYYCWLSQTQLWMLYEMIFFFFFILMEFGWKSGHLVICLPPIAQ